LNASWVQITPPVLGLRFSSHLFILINELIIMDWKKFLKPTIWKFIIPLVFIAFFFLVEFYQVNNRFVLPNWLYQSFLFLPTYYLIVALSGVYYSPIFVIILNMIIWYFLSSIVDIQENRKNKLIGSIVLVFIIIVNGFINLSVLRSYSTIHF
jgi:hypothetical protein